MIYLYNINTIMGLSKNIQENIMNKIYKLQGIIHGVLRVNKNYKIT